MTVENPLAFPVQGIPEWYEGQPGMTLRDYFAGQFLTGITSNAAALRIYADKDGGPVEAMTRDAYQVADAMLSARQETRHGE